MLDNYGIAALKAIKIHNETILSTSYSSRVRNDLNRGNSESFSESLKKVSVENSSNSIAKEKEQEAKDILVDSTLSKRMLEHRIISKLVKEKFDNNPYLKNKVNFESELVEENNTKESEPKEIVNEKTAREECLETLEMAIKRLNEHTA